MHVAVAMKWWQSLTPMYVERTITQAEAILMLEGAPDVNRQVVQGKVEKMTREMRDGTFAVVAHQLDLIGFDTVARCLNGQHRLWAFIESGLPSFTFAFRLGLPGAVIVTIDDHVPRNASTVYQLAHGKEPRTPKRIAVANRILTASRTRPRGGFGRPERFAILDAHVNAIDFALEVLPQTGTRVKGLSAAAIAAVVARATYTVPLDRLKRFAVLLTTGLAHDDDSEADRNGGCSVILLRDWVARNGAGSVALQTELYGKTERALRAYLDGEALVHLYAARIELFPLPGEPDPRWRQVDARRSERS